MNQTSFLPDRAQNIPLAALLGALSYALDLTEGQPVGHCVRATWIGMQVGRRMGLNQDQLWELYYTILLKDLGCSSNAARIASLFGSDDQVVKPRMKVREGRAQRIARQMNPKGIGAVVPAGASSTARRTSAGNRRAYCTAIQPP